MRRGRADTRAIDDTEVRELMSGLDAKRANLLAAFNRLLGDVDAGKVNAEKRTQRVVDRRLAAFQREGNGWST